jgi:hypothetical protein
LLHGILHLDGKLWRTLPLLAWHPGELTRRYIHGERAKFVSPFAIFLFSIFLMFAVLQVHGASPDVEMTSAAPLREEMDQLRRGLQRELGNLRVGRTRVRGKNAEGPVASPTSDNINARIAQLQQDIATLDSLRAQAARLRSRDEKHSVRIGLGRIGGGNYVIEEFDRNPRLAFYKLQSNGYKFSWLLIPISVPFLWLLFLGDRRFRIYDHMVFVTYSMAFMSLLMTLLSVMGFLGAHAAIKSVMSTFIPPLHMYRQIKHAYALGWLSALVRTAFLAGFCLVITTIYLALLLIII